MTKCTKRMVSKAIPHHVHTCMGDHSASGDHFCKRCGRWWKKESK
jgi:hypothetical protein